MKKARAFIVIMSLIILSGCQTARAPQSTPEIMVFAAASLTESFEEIGEAFEKKENIQVRFNFAGSQALTNKLLAGEKAAVFAAASGNVMEPVIQKGIIKEKKDFTENSLVACVNKKSTVKLEQFSDLGQKDLKLIVAHKSVPVGQKFEDALSKQHTKLQASVKANVKSEEMNVKDVLAKILVGAGDVGIVYTTDVSEKQKSQVEVKNFPELTKSTVKYPIGICENSDTKVAGHKFVDFVLSKEGQEILQKFGFVKPS